MSAPAHSDPVPVVHIGYHRAGSSFLQLQAFPLLDGYAETLSTPSEVMDALGADPGPGVRFTLYSNESLVGTTDRDEPERADELHRIAPNLKVLIVIRSQRTILRGHYFLYLKRGGTDSFRTYWTRRTDRLFRYNELVDRYRGLFGAENVYVMLFEDLVSAKRETLAALFGFLGAAPGLSDRVEDVLVKPSADALTMRVMRLRNLLLCPVRALAPGLERKLRHAGVPMASLLRRLSERFRITYRFSPADLAALDRAYGPGNRTLFRSLGKDITGYGYPG